MTHGATDKIPSIELFRSADDLSALRIIGASSTCTYPSASATQCNRMGSRHLSRFQRRAQRIRLRSRNRYDIHPRTSPSLRRTRHEFRQHHLGRRQTTPFRTAAPVEGGGGDGLDEVDKFIHDALNQAPPIEGGASPIEGGGEPDLGALGIHGHTNRWSTTGYCEAVFDANKTLKITLVIPDWSPSPLTAGIPLQIPPEKRYTVTQMASHAARRDGMSRFTDSADPHMTDLLLPSSAEHSFRGHRVKDVFLWQEGDFINSVAEIHTANKGTTFVYLIGLLEYHPEVWDQVAKTQSLANMFRKVEPHAWPGWDGLIVGYDTNTQVYEIAVSNGEFDDAKKNEFDVKGSADL
ncbi:hypothetical protein RI054_14g68190 [Pseudoscourfieldia marina]